MYIVYQYKSTEIKAMKTKLSFLDVQHPRMLKCYKVLGSIYTYAYKSLIISQRLERNLFCHTYRCMNYSSTAMAFTGLTSIFPHSFEFVPNSLKPTIFCMWESNSSLVYSHSYWLAIFCTTNSSPVLARDGSHKKFHVKNPVGDAIHAINMRNKIQQFKNFLLSK